MNRFLMDHEPTFAELWDVCVRGPLYDVPVYTAALKDLLQEQGLSEQSRLIDVSAGGGFPALELISDGWAVACTDGAEDEVALFNAKAARAGLTARCSRVLWNDLGTRYAQETFDGLFCRGNSFIYAAGGWNETVHGDAAASMEQYRDTMRVFYSLLRPGGMLYVDKFKDSEETNEEVVGEIEFPDGRQEQLIFWTERLSENRLRQASLIRRGDGYEKKVPNVTYELSAPELENILKSAGFSSVHKVSVPAENHFDVWIARK